LVEMIRAYERAAATMRLARVACVALNCREMDEEARSRAISEVEYNTGLPAGDVLAGDGPKLWEAVASALDQSA
jgi:uncharacterized NAD-dependent epimerase/dehydratase family protein